MGTPVLISSPGRSMGKWFCCCAGASLLHARRRAVVGVLADLSVVDVLAHRALIAQRPTWRLIAVVLPVRIAPSGGPSFIALLHPILLICHCRMSPSFISNILGRAPGTIRQTARIRPPFVS